MGVQMNQSYSEAILLARVFRNAKRPTRHGKREDAPREQWQGESRRPSVIYPNRERNQSRVCSALNGLMLRRPLCVPFLIDSPYIRLLRR